MYLSSPPVAEPWIVDLECSPGFAHGMVARVPCLLRAHWQGAWVSCLGRRLTQRERARFQGLHWDTLIQHLPAGVAATALGNAMSVNVCSCILAKVLAAIGHLPSDASSPWACRITAQSEIAQLHLGGCSSFAQTWKPAARPDDVMADSWMTCLLGDLEEIAGGT